MKLEIWAFVENLSRISRWILLRMRNISYKCCRENQNTRFMFSNFFSENREVYEIMSKNEVEPKRPQMAIRWRVACWISKATRAQAHAIARAPTFTYMRAHARTGLHTEICKNCCFSTATMVSWTHLSVTLYIHCLSCFIYEWQWIQLESPYRHKEVTEIAVALNNLGRKFLLPTAVIYHSCANTKLHFSTRALF